MGATVALAAADQSSGYVPLLVALLTVVLGGGGLAGFLTARAGSRRVDNERNAQYDQRIDADLTRLRDRNDYLEAREDAYRDALAAYRAFIHGSGVNPDTVYRLPLPTRVPDDEEP